MEKGYVPLSETYPKVAVASRLFLFGLGFALFLGRALVEDHVHQDAHDQAGGDGADLHGAEVQRQAADAAHQNGSDHEQVPIVAQIHRLQHLQAADRDEAVQRDAHAAHDAGGDGVDEADEGVEEAQQDAVHTGQRDRADGGVARDGNAAHGFAVGGVGAAAEGRG